MPDGPWQDRMNSNLAVKKASFCPRILITAFMITWGVTPNPNPKFPNRQGAKSARKTAHSGENRRNL